MKRSGPITRKRAKPKRRPARPCSWSGRCNARPTVHVSDDERYCPKHSKKIADTVVGAWVKYVRDKQCVYCHTDKDLEWAHIRSRGAHPSLHWYVGPTTDEPGNSVALCRAHHFSFTRHQARWEMFVEQRWPGLYTRLIHLEIENAGKSATPDLAELIREYRERMAA